MQYLMRSPHHPSPSPTLDISLQSRSPCQVLPLKADGVEVTNIKHKALARSTGGGGQGRGGRAGPVTRREAGGLFGLAQASQ